MRLDFDMLAKEYGLEIEKHDHGRYKQWKDAEVYLFLPNHIGGQAIAWAIFPPREAIEEYHTKNVSVWSNLYKEHDGNFHWHRHGIICNDDFNERYLREVIEDALKVINDTKE